MCRIAPRKLKSSVCALWFRSFFIAVTLIFTSLPILAQGNRGRILGNVTDQTGGNVAGATVTITDVARGIPHVMTTDTDGLYFAPDLLPGTYTVKVEAKGFKVFQRKNVLVEVGQDVRVDVVLQTGSQTETVTVTGQVPMVDTTNTTLGGTISNTTINELPLNGRNYQNLLDLRPGTTIYPGGGPWTQTTNGARPEDTSYLVDGLSNDEPFMGFSVTNAAAVAGDAATILPIDAIQEFNTQVNPKAEFGWKTGAITSVGLKSGTNVLHGSAYAFGRSDSFDARNYFNPVGTPKTPVELEQFGGSAGGHIIRDKLFYFGAYEGRLYTVGNSIQVNRPTAVSVGDPSISIPDALAGLQAQGIPFSTQSLYVLGCPSNVTAPYTGCTGGLYGPNSSQSKTVESGFPNTDSSKNVLGKVDYHISDHHAISGSYFFGNDTLLAEDAPELLPEYRTNVHSRAQAAAGHWAWTPNPRWVNEVRVGYTRYVLDIIPDNVNIQYQLNTGVTNPVLGGVPNVRIDGFTELGGFHNFPKIVGPDNVYDFIDQVSFFHGKHAFKFGGEFRVDKVHQGTFRGGRGRIRFQSNFSFPGETPLESFLAGTPNSASLLVGDPTRDMTQKLFAGFFQDDYRITKRVTLNLGLRYEFQGVPTEANNLLGNWEPTVGLEQVGKNISSLYKPDHKNFSPRFGIAWDVTGKGTTVVRAGGSILFDLLSMSTFLSQQDTNNTVTLGANVVPTGAPLQVGGVTTPGIGNIVASGITLSSSQLNWNGSAVGGATIYPSNLVQQVACGDGVGNDAGPCDIFAMDRNYRTPYVSTWTLGIQHAFSGKISLDVAYVGNHGTKLTGIRDINQVNIATGVQPYAAKFPYLGYINYYGNIYKSNYNGLQTTFTGRNYHGLSFLVGYTYSHALDNQSYSWNQYLPQNSMDPAAEYGNSDFDIRHRLTASVTYDLPGIKSWGQLLQGWEINTILTLQSGQPWQTFDTSNNFSGSNEFADRWNLFGPASNFKSGGQNSIPLCVNGAPGGCSYISPAGTVNFSDAQTAAMWSACLSKASTPALMTALLAAAGGGTGGCYVSTNGQSFLIPNGIGQFGNLGRNVFRDTGFHNLDFSVSKSWKFKERYSVQFRAEMFNFTNHPNFANPWGGTSGFGAGATADPSVGPFGCGCATPDVAAVNPVLGSGSARAIQFGLKLLF
jgi:Carboxypeptidase regulatory-like domain/TonB dependent receptor-like, beta-barrel